MTFRPELRRALLAAAAAGAMVLAHPALAQQGGMGQRAGQADTQGRLSPAQVRTLQETLNDSGFDAGPIDGQWGPRTARAVAAFQRSQGMEPTGSPDAATLQALGVVGNAGTGATGRTGAGQGGGGMGR